MTRKSLWIIPFLWAATIVTPTVLKADVTYTVDQTIGTGSATGTITTDGATGILGTGDIVSWNLTLNDNTNTVDITPSNSKLELAGSDLTASATDLNFDFSATDNGYFALGDFSHNINGLCYESANVTCEFYSSAIYLYNLKGDNVYPYTLESGDPVIASVTPEPSTAILWLIGIGLMILTRKRIGYLL